jgi:signal peptidase I
MPMSEELNEDHREPNHPPQRTGAGRWIARLLREGLETIIPALLIALLINVFVGQATRVEGQSMEPSLHSDQRLVVEKLSYRFHGPRRFDIVVLKLPDQSDELLIKRVIGLPGETVEIRDGHIFLNGVQLREPFIVQDTRAGRHGLVTVPPLHVYVLGDNRNHSNDSRSFGPIPIDNIVGRAWLSYWPLEELGPVE